MGSGRRVQGNSVPGNQEWRGIPMQHRVLIDWAGSSSICDAWDQRNQRNRSQHTSLVESSEALPVHFTGLTTVAPRRGHFA